MLMIKNKCHGKIISGAKKNCLKKYKPPRLVIHAYSYIIYIGLTPCTLYKLITFLQAEFNHVSNANLEPFWKPIPSYSIAWERGV